MSSVHQPVHGGVDGRRRTPPAVQAVVERGDHLVLAVNPGYTSANARIRSSRNTASPPSVSVPRSPPDPLTHINSTSPPVTGSVSVPFADVFPPA